MKTLILVMSFLSIIGCSPLVGQKRIQCDNGFMTLWARSAWIDSGIIEWYDDWKDARGYKIPEGVTCRTYYRTIKVNN